MDGIMKDQRCHFVPERIRHLAGILPQDVCRWSSQRGLDFAFLRQPRIAAQSISFACRMTSPYFGPCCLSP